MSKDDAQFHWGEGNKYAHEGLKSLLYLNGTASVAVIGFMAPASSHRDFTSALAFFALGAVSAVAGFITAYMAQLKYANGHLQQSENPFAAGWPWHNAAYVVAGLSLAMFATGLCAMWLKVQ